MKFSLLIRRSFDSACSVCSAELSKRKKERKKERKSLRQEKQVVQNNVISYAEWTHGVTD